MTPGNPVILDTHASLRLDWYLRLNTNVILAVIYYNRVERVGLISISNIYSQNMMSSKSFENTLAIFFKK